MASKEKCPPEGGAESPGTRAEDTRVRLSIENNLTEPYFNESVYLPYITGQQLIRYLEEAAECTKAFKFSATYIPKFGYFIQTINGATGNWASDKTSWTIISDGKPTKGASSYVPHKGDHVIFKYNNRNLCLEEMNKTKKEDN